MKPKDAESSLQREPAEPPGRAIRASLLLRLGQFERVQVNHLGSSYSEQTGEYNPMYGSLSFTEVVLLSEPCPSRRSRSLRVSEDRCLQTCEGWERAFSYRDRHSLRAISGRTACVNRWPSLAGFGRREVHRGCEAVSSQRRTSIFSDLRLLVAHLNCRHRRGGISWIRRYPLEIAIEPKELRISWRNRISRPRASSR